MSLATSSISAQSFYITSEQVPWEQVDARSFRVFSERERYDTLDRFGRFVCAVQTDKTWPQLEELSVHWQVKAGQTIVAEKTETITQGALAVNFDLQKLQPGRFDINADLRQGDKVLQSAQSFFRYVPASTPPQSGRIALNLPRGVPISESTFPITTGVPFPKGALWSADNVRVVDNAGKAIPFQTCVRSRWGYREESSIRWLGVDFQATPSPAWWPQRKDSRYFLEFGTKITKAPAPLHQVWVRETEDGYLINTETLRFLVRRKGFNLIDDVTIGGKAVLSSSPKGGAYLIDHEGNTYRAANDTQTKITIEEQGPLRVVLRAEGWYVKDGTTGQNQSYTLPTDKLCKFITRIEAYAGKPYVRVLHTWINTFDTFTVRLRDMGLSLPVQNATQAEFGVEESTPLRQPVGADGLYLIQHKPDEFAIEDEAGKALAKGKHSAGWAVAETKNGLISIGHRDTWQRFPKELEVLPDALKLHIWPAHGKAHAEIKETNLDQLHKLWFAHRGLELNMQMPWEYFFAVAQKTGAPDTAIETAGGMAYSGIHASGMGVAVTSDFLIHFAAPNELDKVRDVATCFQTAPSALPDTKWLCDSLAIGYAHPYDPEKFADIESVISEAMRGYWETQNESGVYGMWLYRSWQQHYEGNGVWDPYRIYNGTHHYDAFMPWLFYARSGDPFYLEQGAANIRQLSDVQTIHYTDPAYKQQEIGSPQGRLVGATRHTNGYAPWGGDHGVLAHLTCYNAMILAYYLTGDLRLREVVVDEWQKTITSDRKNPEFTRADRSKGNNSGGGRDTSNPLGELIDLYQLTYNPAVLVHIAGLYEHQTDDWWEWGQRLHNVLLFHGSEMVGKQVKDHVQQYLDSGGQKMLISRAMSQTELMSLAAIIDPQKNLANDVYQSTEVPLHLLWAAQMKRHGTMYFHDVPDYVLYLPRAMYAMDKAGIKGGTSTVDDVKYAQPLLRPYKGWSRSIVREDKDQPFDISIIAKIGPAGIPVRVFSPDNKKVLDVTVPPGNHSPFKITVPRDGVSGQYVIFIKAEGALMPPQLPLTSLPSEVYSMQPDVYWFQKMSGSEIFGLPEGHSTRFFTRSRDTQPETVDFQPSRASRGQVVDAETGKVLIDRKTGDKPVAEDLIQTQVEPKGVWLVAWGLIVGSSKQLTLSVTPDRWFAPDADKVALSAGDN